MGNKSGNLNANTNEFLNPCPLNSRNASVTKLQLSKSIWIFTASKRVPSEKVELHFLCGNEHRPLRGRCPLTPQQTLNSTLMTLVRQS